IGAPRQVGDRWDVTKPVALRPIVTFVTLVAVVPLPARPLAAPTKPCGRVGAYSFAPQVSEKKRTQTRASGRTNPTLRPWEKRTQSPTPEEKTQDRGPGKTNPKRPQGPAGAGRAGVDTSGADPQSYYREGRAPRRA